MTTSTIICADATRLPLADRSVNLTVGSPPYCEARTYDDGTLPEGHVVGRDCREWVAWMLDVTEEALRVTDGPVIWIAAGVTRDRNYWPACEGLMWEWFLRGGSMYRPCYWKRVGICGSGGDQWFRADVEYCMGFKRPGPLPWTDNTACGHPPKWAPGGEMAHRITDGTRVNQWGKPGSMTGTTATGNKEKATIGKPRPSHRTVNGKMRRMAAESGEPKVLAAIENMPVGAKLHTKQTANGQRVQCYTPPAIANPGTDIDAVWSEHDETMWLNIATGGGQLGAKIAHENEAPFPEKVAEFFIRSLCPPGGTVLDPFSGSGTTAAVAKRTGRNAIASDLRTSQCELTRRRLQSVQPELAFG